MMRSMYTAVTGLRTHQSKMDTIGNNIANVNTVGYKKGQVTFKESFSQVMRGASSPQGGKGGTNPQQVGMGVSTGSVNTIHTQGNAQRTDNPTDLMINGEGFFVVSDDANFNNKYYTRAGDFSLDRDGSLVTSDGFKVLGYGVDKDGNINTSDIRAIQISKSEKSAPKATDKIVFEGNLDSRLEKNAEQKINTVIHDSLGNAYELRFKVAKQADGGNWKVSLDRVTEKSTGNYTEEGLEDSDKFDMTLNFDKNGDLVVGETAKPIEIKANLLTDLKFDKNDKTGDSANTTSPKGSFKDIMVIDPKDETTYNKIHQYANEGTLKPNAKTGNTSGDLNGFTIDPSGIVQGIFTNGERRALGQIMVAKFDNNMGLQKVGNNFFIDTRNSGEPNFGQANSAGFGTIDGERLEMSNVDIAYEFTEMITTQRGFQANSRIITTSDEMLQELVNIKR